MEDCFHCGKVATVDNNGKGICHFCADALGVERKPLKRLVEEPQLKVILRRDPPDNIRKVSK